MDLGPVGGGGDIATFWTLWMILNKN
jgi:hypothetical protein